MLAIRNTGITQFRQINELEQHEIVLLAQGHNESLGIELMTLQSEPNALITEAPATTFYTLI